MRCILIRVHMADDRGHSKERRCIEEASRELMYIASDSLALTSLLEEYRSMSINVDHFDSKWWCWYLAMTESYRDR